MAAFASSSSSSSSSSPSLSLSPSMLIDKMCALLEGSPNTTNNSCFPVQFDHFAKTLEEINKIEQPHSVMSSTVANKNITSTMDYCPSSILSNDLLTVNPKKRKSKPNTCAPSSEGKNEVQVKMKEVSEKVGIRKKGKLEKATEGYIHVRAKRGQATDSHSLAERVRRERISERMRLLQALVPGCGKVTGKAPMLDEIINYVQSLQNQVEFLSMKLASVTPAMYSCSNTGMDLMDSFPPHHQNNLNSLVPMDQLSPTATNNTYPQFLDNSVDSLLFQQPQIFPSDLSQMWEVEDQQRQDMISQSDIINNTLFSFH